MAESPALSGGTVEPFPGPMPSTTVTDELRKILALLKDACPADAIISFDFDGRLHAHIDVHKQEDLTRIELILPQLGPGLFHSLVRGNTPNRPFHHRLSALVAR